MNLIRAFLPKIKTLFFKFWKRAGETSPPSPLVTRLARNIEFTESSTNLYQISRGLFFRLVWAQSDKRIKIKNYVTSHHWIQHDWFVAYTKYREKTVEEKLFDFQTTVSLKQQRC